MGRRQFHAGEKGQGGNFNSDIHEERLGADESYWIVFPVKFTGQF